MKALFPGTFNPPTLGHLEIIQRAARLCDHLVVAIGESPHKYAATFSVEERMSLLRALTKDMDNVEIISFSGLVIDCAKDLKVDFLLRGLRNGSDFDYEYQMAAANRQMTGIETVFLAASPLYSHLSSTLIREIAVNGHRLHGFIPDAIEAEVFAKLSTITK